MADLEKSPFVSWPRPDPNAPPPPLDIAAFLRARLDEREAKANGALSGPWVVEEHTYETVVTVDGGQVVATVDGLRDGWHIADNDPKFVLADVAAKRQIIDAHQSLWTTGPLPLRSAPACKTCSSEVEVWPCTTLRLLALPHAAHPDYREEWKP